jgi:hypothetical protein
MDSGRITHYSEVILPACRSVDDMRFASITGIALSGNLWVPEEWVELLAGAGTDYLRFALEVTNAYSLIVDRLALAIREIHHFRCCESRNLHPNYRIVADPSEPIVDNSSKRAAVDYVSCRTRTPYPPPNRTLPLGPCSAS